MVTYDLHYFIFVAILTHFTYFNMYSVPFTMNSSNPVN